jgi:hypothetical protein
MSRQGRRARSCSEGQDPHSQSSSA